MPLVFATTAGVGFAGGVAPLAEGCVAGYCSSGLDAVVLTGVKVGLWAV